MYQQHFGLKNHPFAKEVEVDHLYKSAALLEMEARLKHAIELRGIALVTGDPGSGKTTACRRVIDDLPAGLNQVFYVPNSTGNVMDLYKAICWEFGLATLRSRSALYKAIRDHVTKMCLESRIQPILIIDEAHHLRSDVLEDLRLLTNYEMDSKNRLCLIFVGQTELRRRIGMAVHEALNQRIVVRQQLEGMGFDETVSYIRHRLELAGTQLPIFEPPALNAIFQAAAGLPRKINLLCHHVLLFAATDRAKSATADHVLAAQEALR